MRKNKSFRGQVFPKPKGKEISIELEGFLGKSLHLRKDPTKAVNSSEVTRREYMSPDWENSNSLSSNVLKEIISYSNLPQARQPRGKHNSTIAVFDKKYDDSHRPNRVAKRLILEGSSRMIESASQLSVSGTSEMQQSSQSNITEDSHVKKTNEYDCEIRKVSFSKRSSLLSLADTPLPKEQPTFEEFQKNKRKNEENVIRFDELQTMEETLRKECSDVVSIWEELYSIQASLSAQEQQKEILFSNFKQTETHLRKLHNELYEATAACLTQRQSYKYQTMHSREKVLHEAENAHNELIRKLTMREFEEIVLFNIKVTIPACSSKTSIGSIYEQLFRNKSAKRFTMILKKHASQMDTYDSRVVSEFIKKIIELQAQLFKSDVQQQPLSNDSFLSSVEQLVQTIKEEKRKEEELERQMKAFEAAQRQLEVKKKGCRGSLAAYVQKVNTQVRLEFKKSTQNEADFCILLQDSLNKKYLEFVALKKEQRQIMGCL